MELSTTSCVIGAASILIYFYIWKFVNWVWFEPKRKEKFLRDQGLKGTSYKFLLGDVKEMMQMTMEAKLKPMSLTHNIAFRVSPFYYKSVTTHGKNCFTWIGPKPVVHISEPNMIRDVLANQDQFLKWRGGNPYAKYLLSGVANTTGDKWVKHRKIINHAFRAEKLKHMLPAFYESCTDMIHKWEELLREKSSFEIDVWPHLQMFTRDAVARATFGSSYKEGIQIFELQKEQTKLVLNAVQKIYFPGLKFLPTKSNKRMKQIDREVNASIRSIIDKRVFHIKAGETRNDNDLLGILLYSNCKELIHHNSDFGLTIEELMQECKFLYFVSQETTTDLLVWTMILLGQHTDWQTRAREEILHVLGKRKPEFNELNHLKIINMVFKEVLRLYPPAITLSRLLQKESKLGDLTLPSQTLVQINTLLLHHDHDIWGDDASEFKPERFSGGGSYVTNKAQATYLPFGGGPRNCSGQSFAMLEAKMAFVTILQRFSFGLSPSYSHSPHTVITLQPQFGAHLIMHKL